MARVRDEKRLVDWERCSVGAAGDPDGDAVDAGEWPSMKSVLRRDVGVVVVVIDVMDALLSSPTPPMSRRGRAYGFLADAAPRVDWRWRDGPAKEGDEADGSIL